MSGLILLSTASEEKAAPYLEALESVGVPGEQLLVVTPDDLAAVPDLASRAAALVLCGGADVEPERYGETLLPDASVETVPDRDVLEWALLDAARDRHLPVWGVCRGFQVLNVYLGGTLWQDLPTQHPSAIQHEATETPETLAHTVQVVAPSAPLGELLAREVPRVNSRHHQAVKRMATGFVPVAFSPDRLAEAAFLDRPDWWVRGVQWHPENLIALPQQRALWTDFVRAAGFPGPK
ncbi:MAG TPA: gamma-glutamyl-gamma-aminobutyrate hydrolase family protein [Thermoanaerobaculia bacterium]|nr:gamma-glutamyl-gamma-aminobutyrate hydrolase family protein [Thermoanaerobaculia bacterium]